MTRFSEKIHLALQLPTEELPSSDQQQIRQALEALGYCPVTFPLSFLQQLYPLCRNSGFDITVTLVAGEIGWIAAAVEAGDTTACHYGLAVDYGSTTIVMALVDLHSGVIIDKAAAVNGQTVYGTDILTRITYALEDPAHMDDLQRVTAETFDRLLEQLTASSGIDAFRCPVMIVSGNTTMVHFLLKLHAWTVFAAPYAPVTTDPGRIRGQEVGMAFPGVLYFVPAASNYIGGDIISGLLTLDLHKEDSPAMFFDIGTNGELVVGTREWLLAGAGAAGPALEGYISRSGMRAAAGAVDHITIEDGRLRFTTIGGRPPVGICGSGIMDLLAQMRLHGWINIAGELEPAASDRIFYLPRERQYAVAYATGAETGGEPLLFTQTDIRQYLDTKAAACTMVECLLEAAGVEPQELRRCYLSGAFSAHSDLESAITIGMFPDLPRDRFAARANTSLDGARSLLLDRSLLDEARQIIDRIYAIQFASIPDFLIRMQAAKFIPHTDMERYPTVRRRLDSAGTV